MDHLTILTHLKVEGGGYHIECVSPRAELAMSLFLACYNMAEPEGPVHVWAEGLADEGAHVVLKKVDFGFDPHLGKNFAVTNAHIEELDDLRRHTSLPARDARLEAIGRLLYRAFESHAATIQWLQVQVTGKPSRTFSDLNKIARILMALTGSQASDPHSDPRMLNVKVYYHEDGKPKVLIESFGISESILHPGGAPTRIKSLADPPPTGNREMRH